MHRTDYCKNSLLISILYIFIYLNLIWVFLYLSKQEFSLPHLSKEWSKIITQYQTLRKYKKTTYQSNCYLCEIVSMAKKMYLSRVEFYQRLNCIKNQIFQITTNYLKNIILLPKIVLV